MSYLVLPTKLLRPMVRLATLMGGP